MISIGSKCEVVIEQVVFGGDGLCRLDGKICWVPFSLPGEKLVVEIVQEKKDQLRAKIVQILSPSPHPNQPACLHYTFCGGCQYQHVTYEEELRLKHRQITEILNRAIGCDVSTVSPVVASPKEYRYRHTMTFHPIHQKSKNQNGFKMGLVGVENETIFPIKDCWIAHTAFQSLLGKVILKRNIQDKYSLKLSSDQSLVGDEDERFLLVPIGDKELLVSSKGFCQTNPEVTHLLTQTARVWIEALSPEIVYDWYAGAGTFSFLSASKVPKIVAVEESHVSVQAYRMNAQRFSHPDAQITEARVEHQAKRCWQATETGRKLILADPPRQGLDAGLSQWLADGQGAVAMIYISCEPMTLARDLKIILSKGQWKLDQIRPFDMFPKTHHLETACLLMPRNRP